MSEVYEIKIGCSISTTIIDLDKQGFVDLIQNRDEETEQLVRVSKEQWELMKKAVDFCFDSLAASRASRTSVSAKPLSIETENF